MNLPAAFFAVRLLVHDTFRQAWSSGVLAMTGLVTAVCVALCLSVAVVGERPGLALPADTSREWMPEREAAKLGPDMVRSEGVDVPTGDLTVGFGTFRVPQTRDRSDAVRFLELLLGGFVADTAGVLLTLVWTAGFLPAFLAPS